MNERITLIDNLKHTGRRYNVRARVVKSQKMTEGYKRQEGTFSDPSGEITFVIWADSGLPYLEQGKEYVLKNLLLYDYKGTLQLQFDRFSESECCKAEKLKNMFQKVLEKEKQIKKVEKTLYHKEKDIELAERNIDENKKKTMEAVEYLKAHRAQMKKQNLWAKIKFVSVIVFIIILGLNLSGYSVKITENIKKVSDSTGTKKTSSLLDEKIMDKSSIEIEQCTVREDVDDNEITSQKHGISEQVSLMDANDEDDSEGNCIEIDTIFYENPVIYVNSEEDEEILMSLPGIGPKRVKTLIKERPFEDIEDVIASKIGIGEYWAEKWKEDIKAGRIIFD